MAFSHARAMHELLHAMIGAKRAVSGIGRRLLCLICYGRIGSNGYGRLERRLRVLLLLLLLWRRWLLRRRLYRGRYGGCGRGFLLVSVLSLQQRRPTGLPSFVHCSLILAHIMSCTP